MMGPSGRADSPSRSRQVDGHCVSKLGFNTNLITQTAPLEGWAWSGLDAIRSQQRAAKQQRRLGEFHQSASAVTRVTPKALQ